MRIGYIVSYDITCPKRWRKVYRAMMGYGDHVQYSVFRCELSDADKVAMIARLDALINHKDDQVLVVNMGPAPGRSDDSVIALGKPYTPKERVVVVVGICSEPPLLLLENRIEPFRAAMPVKRRDPLADGETCCDCWGCTGRRCSKMTNYVVRTRYSEALENCR